MDFASGRYPLNETKYSMGSYYGSETDKNNSQLELSNLENAIPFTKYGFNNIRQINDEYTDDISADYDEDDDEEKLADGHSCENSIEQSSPQFVNSKPRLDSLVPHRDSYIDDKMTAADDKHNAMEETNYIVKLEKMSPDDTVGVREPKKSSSHIEKKKHGKYILNH